jgi:hypothetical protein
MNGAGDKKIEFKFAVDQRSLQTAKTALRELTSEVKKLVETLSRARSMTGGASLFGGISGKQGGVNASQQATVNGNAVSGVSSAVTADAKALTTLARTSSDAMRTMTTTTVDALRRQTQQAREAAKVINDLAQGWKDLAAAAGSSMGSASMGTNNYGRPMSAGSPMGSASMGTNNYGFPIPTPMSAGTRLNINNPWLAGGISGFSGSGGYGGGGGGFSEASHNGRPGPFTYTGTGFSQLMNPIGLIRQVMAGGAIMAGYDAVVNSIVGNDSAKSTLAFNPLDTLRQRGQVSSTYGNIGMDIRRNFASQYAMRKLTPTDLSTVMSKEVMDAIVQRAYVASGNTGKSSEVLPKLSTAIGQIVMGEEVDLDMRTRIALEKELNAIPGGIAGLFHQMYEAKKNSMSVRDMTYINEYQAGLSGRLALQRLAGIGEGRRKGETQNTDLAARLGHFTPFTSEELAGMRAQIGQIAGRGLMGRGAGMLLSRQYGGLNNVVQLFAAGAQYGTPGALVNTLNAGIGKGGVDITAGARIADLVSNALLSGGMSMPTGGSALTEGLLAATQTGSVGGDMRMARIMGQGLAGYGNILSGGIDNLQKGINVLAANEAMGDFSLGARHAVMRLKPEQMIEMLRSGKVSTELASRGVGIDQLRAYYAAQSRFDFARYHGGTGRGGAVEEAALGAQRSGGSVAYIQSLLKSKGIDASSAAGQMLIREQARLLGSALADMGEAASDEQGYGIEMAKLTAAGLLNAAKGKGAHDPAGKQAIAAKKKEDEARADFEERVGSAKLGKEIIKRGGEIIAADKLDEAGTAGPVQDAAKKAAKALSDFSDAMRPVVNILREIPMNIPQAGRPTTNAKTGKNG